MIAGACEGFRSTKGPASSGVDILRSAGRRPGSSTHFSCSFVTYTTRGSAIAEEPRDALRQFKYYGRFLTELLTRSSANPEEPCEHTVS